MRNANFLSLSFLFLIAQTAFAAELSPVVVRGQENSQGAASSSFVTVIRPDKEQNQFKTVTEVLQAASSVTVSQAGGLGQLSTVSIRGSSAEQVSVFLDGVRLNSASGGAVDFSTIPLSSLDRIEIIRGGASQRYGSDAIGGVILLYTKKGEEQKKHFDASFGSYLTFQTAANWLIPDGQDQWVLAHNHLSSKGDFSFRSSDPNTTGTFKRNHNSFYSENLLAKWHHTFSEILSADTSADTFFTDRNIPGTADETILLAPANPLEATEKMARNTFATRFDFNKVWSIGATNYFQWNHFEDPSPGAAVAPIHSKSYSEAPAAYLLLQQPFSNDGSNGIWTLRYDYRWDLFDENRQISRDRHTHSVYVEPEISFGNDRFVLSPGGRYEDASDFPDRWLWKVGAKYFLFPQLALKGNVEEAFRYPNFSELYFPDQGYIKGNAALSPESSFNYDAGFSWQSDSILLESAYFQHKIHNSILFVPINAFTVQPENTLAATEQGVETSADLQLTDWLRLQGNYTWLLARFDSNHNRLPGRSEHTAYGKLEATSKGLSAYFDARYRSRYPVNTANTTFLSSRIQLNTGLTYRWKLWFTTLEAKDLTNVQIYDNQAFPLPRRSYFLKIGVDV